MTESIYVRSIYSDQLERVDALGNLTAVCLWAALGLAVTALLFSLGYGLEITTALAAG